MLGQIVDEAATRFGTRVAVSSVEGDLSYSELAESSRTLAAGLFRRGVREGDVVALVLPSGGDWLVTAVAANRLGAIFAGLSPVSSQEERAHQQKLVSPRLTIADPGLVDGLSLRAPMTVLDPGSRGSSLAAEGESATGTTESAHLAPLRPCPDRGVAICFTSGTTGYAKAALFCERQIEAIQRIDIGEHYETVWDGGSPMLASTQFAHVGMATKFAWYLRLGATLHVMPRWRADDALRLVAGQQMPTIGAVAPQLALMLRSPLMDKLDFSSVRMVIAGGAASPAALVQEVRQRFAAGYSIRYSSTESGGVGLATDADTDDETEWTTIGRPRRLVDIRIAPTGETNTKNEPGRATTEGELQLRSPAVMERYWNDPGATAAAFTEDGWLRTGDLARLDERGRLQLVGRSSDMYIRGGYNVFPAEVESVIMEHPAVDGAVIVPRPHQVMGEVGLALISVRDGNEAPTLRTLREHCESKLAHYKLPEAVVVVDEVPLTAAQKIDRRAAREMAESVAFGLDS